MNPKVKIKSQGLAGNAFHIGNDSWGAATLIAHCKEMKYKTFKYPLAVFSLSRRYDVADIAELLHHAKRINDADLSYPIILDIDGDICDGYHRCMKAILQGKTEIDAIRMETMPNPDGTVEDHD